MQRFHQVLFAVSLIGLCWLLMQAIHELGHVLGAQLSGGIVTQVIIHPLAISRTDVSPNPHPAIVVWLGPIVGCLLPLALSAFLPRRFAEPRNITIFFAGFCLIANGAYIGLGAFAKIGDCGEMLQTGTPVWAMLAFGTLTVSLGLYSCHRLGSLQNYLRAPSRISPTTARLAFAALVTLVLLEITFASY